MFINTSWIKFQLDINYVNRIIKLLLDNSSEEYTKKQIADEINLAIPKTEAFIYWSRYLGLINRRNYTLTDFGKIYQDLWKLDKDTIYEILYYRCIIFNKTVNYLVNDILYYTSKKYPSEFNNEDIENFFKDKYKELNFENLNNLQKTSNLYLNSMINEAGFGYLGILEKTVNANFYVKKHLPSWKGAFYILVMNSVLLNVNQANLIISTNNIIEGRNNLGRIFMLQKDDVSFIIDELVTKYLLKREKVSTFDQIYIRNEILNEKELIEVLIHND